MAEPDGADAINIDIGEEGYVDGRDLQLEVTSYCVYLGGISEPPSAEQQRYYKTCISSIHMNMNNIILKGP